MKRKIPSSEPSSQSGTIFIFKIVLYLIIGAQWVRLYDARLDQFALPLGLIAGLIFASHEHFQIDRKIEYAVLLVASFIGFWLPLGLNIVL